MRADPDHTASEVEESNIYSIWSSLYQIFVSAQFLVEVKNVTEFPGILMFSLCIWCK